MKGAADAHCTSSTATNMASCHADAGAADASVVDASTDAAAPSPYGQTMLNAEGDDDDCKYHVKWTATPVCSGKEGVTFTVTVTRKTDKSPATGADPYIEGFLNDVHPAPNAGVSKEIGPGVYTVGPVVFDVAGTWSVRYHFYGTCGDDPADSPHGHIAFLVEVP